MSQASQTGSREECFAPSGRRMCFVSGWLAAAIIAGFSCAGRSASPLPDSVLTVGFGVGRPVLSQAVSTVVDILSAEPLVGMGWNGRTLPRLAVDWAWTDSGRTLTLTLRQGVVFHDGTPLTAAAIVPELQRYFAQSGGDRIASISEDGDSHVVIRLREPDGFLLAELSKASIRIGKDRKIGTGPFVYKSREPDYVFESFEKYHLGPPPISKVVVRTYDTPRASWAAMMRGDVKFLWEINRDAVEFVEAGSRAETFSFPRPYHISIAFNVDHPILGRRRSAKPSTKRSIARRL